MNMTHFTLEKYSQQNYFHCVSKKATKNSSILCKSVERIIQHMFIWLNLNSFSVRYSCVTGRTPMLCMFIEEVEKESIIYFENNAIDFVLRNFISAKWGITFSIYVPRVMFSVLMLNFTQRLYSDVVLSEWHKKTVENSLDTDDFSSNLVFHGKLFLADTKDTHDMNFCHIDTWCTFYSLITEKRATTLKTFNEYRKKKCNNRPSYPQLSLEC